MMQAYKSTDTQADVTKESWEDFRFISLKNTNATS